MAESGTGDTGAGREGRPALRRATGVVAYVLVWALVALVGFELMARWAWRDGWRDPDDHGGPQGKALPTYVGLLELARPNLRGINRNVFHRTNSRGLRGPEHSVDPEPRVFRILVGGDSITMGAGVLESDRYTDRLEARLGAGYEVVNLGLSGLNTDGVVTRIEKMWPHYRSHLLVYGLSLNDIEGPAYRSGASGVLPADFARTYWEGIARLERSPSYFWRYLGAWRLARNRGEGAHHAVVLDNWLENPAAWEHFLDGLDRFAAFARARGVCALLLVHTDLADLDAGHAYLGVYERVERAAAERGIAVAQSFPRFERWDGPSDALWVSLFDPHPNAQGQALLADTLHEGLMRLPPACRAER
jgi:lysophospholipase L1-like esterase